MSDLSCQLSLGARKMMQWKKIAARITGFSVPVFGISWNPPKLEVDIAQRVITFLEDRRVLYNPFSIEDPEHCATSVLEIRRFLTTVLEELPNSTGLPQHLRVMRAACREFLDKNGDTAQGRAMYGMNGWTFATHLGDFRRTIGTHVAAICTMYGLGIEGDLAKVLPPAPRPDDA